MEYTPEMYCQEVWDLGRSIMFFNDWLLESYYDVCDPKLTRRLYNLISKYVNKFASDENEFDDEIDLFIKYHQGSFDTFVRIAYNIINQMPERDKVSNYFERIYENLRILNNFLESPEGQEKDWFRIHYDYQNWVKNNVWTTEELNNNIPNNISPNTQPQ